MRKTVDDWKEEFVLIKCEVCGEEFKAATNLRRFCTDCREKRKKDWTEQYYKRKYGGEESSRVKSRKRRVDSPMNLYKLT